MLASPLLLSYLVWRSFRNAEWFPTLPERFGYLPPSWQQTVSGAIWLHAVSVGEVLAAIPLLSELRRKSPRTPLFLSTSTLAGHETAFKRLPGLCDGVFYAPFDFVWAVRRVLRRLRPSAVIILETEIWPSLFRETKRTGAALLLVNGRISDRALPRYLKFAPLFAEILALCDAVLTQSDEMTHRFKSIGATAAATAGNLKYDFTPPPASSLTFGSSEKPLWIAASTSADDNIAEEDAVIAAQKALPGWRLLLAPRKPERFEDAARRLTDSGLRFTRRSNLTDPAADVLLLDSIGELSALFAQADVVFMGGTLAARGGHNILEPAVFGKPVIAGPHLENFRDIETHFTQQNALLRITDGSELAAAILKAHTDPELGKHAQSAAASQTGTADRIATKVLARYRAVCPADRPPQPAFGFLLFFSWLWKAGSAWDRARKLSAARSLPVPVVSVGNITAGGTGKTPMVIELLRDFAPRHPGLLIRGHGRASRGTVLLTTDRPQPIAATGDEAQLSHRATGVPVGISADRYAAGTSLIDATHPGIIFLDDGFQHLQLRRDMDIVLLDALNPFGNNQLLPLGRLREPLEGLARAHAFILTRSDEIPCTNGIEAVLWQYNPKAPVFHARTVVRQWAGDAAFIRTKAVAFCGLGNPESFWRTLRNCGIEPLARFPWEDHHRYKPAELRLLARNAVALGAEVLLTTAKDAVNLDPDYRAIIAPLKLAWLEIGLELDRREELISLISARTAVRSTGAAA